MASWDRIWSGIARLAALDKSLQSPGAKSHRYAFGPRLTEDQLTAWETREGLPLPPDLRAYYAVCGNGGAGPMNGVKPLETLPVRHAGEVPLFDAVMTGTGVALCVDCGGRLIEMPETVEERDGPETFRALFETWLEVETRRFEAVERLYPSARSLDELTAQAEAALGAFPVADYFTSVVGAPRPAALFGPDDQIRNWGRQHGWYASMFMRYKERAKFLSGPAGSFIRMFPRKNPSKG